MTSPADLWYRLSEALGGHDVDPDDRDRIQRAYMALPEGAGWSDLPQDVQRLIEEIEQRPAEAWGDPSEVPDQAE